MKKLRPAVFGTAVGAALLLALTACSPSGNSNTAANSTGTPASGGTIVVALSTDGKCIDPQQVGNNDQIAIARQTVASLTIQDPATGKILPWIASSWDVNSDASDFTFHLRADATFADGTPIDAAAVKANYDRIVSLGAKASLGSSYLKGLTAVTVKDPTTVDVAFGKPNVQFLQASTTFSLGLLSTASTSKTPDQTCTGDFVGSGPFQVASFQPDTETDLTKVASYNLGTAANSHTGAAYADKLQFKIIPEAGVKTGSLQSGQIDVTTGITQNDVPLFANANYTTVTRSNPGVTFNLFPQVTRPLLTDVRVRQAVSWAIDRRTITTAVYGASYDPATAIISSTTPLFQGLDSSELGYDPKKAASLLDAAGWTLGSDGIREKNGQKLSLVVPFYQTADPLVLVQQELKAVGIDLQLKQVQISDLSAIYAGGDYDFQYYNLTRADPDVLRTVLSVDGSNADHRSRSEVDDLLEAQAGEPDTAKRTAIVLKAQQELVDQGLSIPVYQAAGALISDAKVHDVKYEASSRLDFYDAWVTP